VGWQSNRYLLSLLNRGHVGSELFDFLKLRRVFEPFFTLEPNEAEFLTVLKIPHLTPSSNSQFKRVLLFMGQRRCE
jgi:hypothetical protein